MAQGWNYQNNGQQLVQTGSGNEKYAASQLVQKLRESGLNDQQIERMFDEAKMQTSGGYDEPSGGKQGCNCGALEKRIEQLENRHASGASRASRGSKEAYAPARYSGTMKTGGAIRSASITFAAGAAQGVTATSTPTGAQASRLSGSYICAITAQVQSTLSDDLMNISASIETDAIDEPEFQDVPLLLFSDNADGEPQYFAFDEPILIPSDATVDVVFQVDRAGGLLSTNQGDITPMFLAGQECGSRFF